MLNESSSIVTANCSSWAPQTSINHPQLMFSIVVLYSVVGIFSLVGNLTVMFIIFASQEMRTSTNYFVANLVFADLLVTVSSLWMTPLYAITHSWILGNEMCHISVLITSTTVIVSSYSLALIAIDKYMLIVHPLKRSISQQYCLFNIVFLWLIATATASPLVAHTKYYSVPDCNRRRYFHFCIDILWKPDAVRIGYGTLILLLRTLVPFSVIAVCNMSVADQLRRQSQRLSFYRSCGRQIEDLRRQQKIQRLLTSMVLIFALCSLPLDVVNLIKDIQWFKQSSDVFPEHFTQIVTVFVHLLAMTATLWNPILYAWLNENFKRQIRLRIRYTAAHLWLRSSTCMSFNTWNHRRATLEIMFNRMGLSFSSRRVTEGTVVPPSKTAPPSPENRDQNQQLSPLLSPIYAGAGPLLLLALKDEHFSN